MAHRFPPANVHREGGGREQFSPLRSATPWQVLKPFATETSVVGSGVCLAISDAGEWCANKTPPVISFFTFFFGPIPLIYILVVFSAYIHCVD